MLTVEDPKKYNWSAIGLQDCIEGNAMDAFYTFLLKDKIEQELKEKGMVKLYEDLISKIITPLAEIEFNGIDIDKKALDKLENQLLPDREATLKDIYNCNSNIDKNMNLASNKQLVELLYLREDGFNLYPPNKTKKQAPSVDVKTLDKLLDQINEELSNRK